METNELAKKDTQSDCGEFAEIQEMAAHYRMSEAEQEAQLRSFAYGNLHLHDPSITREDIDRAAESSRQTRTDANLVAAAPDLLAACRSMVKAAELHGTQGIEFFEARNSALAAIAKAEGRKNGE